LPQSSDRCRLITRCGCPVIELSFDTLWSFLWSVRGTIRVGHSSSNPFERYHVRLPDITVPPQINCSVTLFRISLEIQCRDGTPEVLTWLRASWVRSAAPQATCSELLACKTKNQKPVQASLEGKYISTSCPISLHAFTPAEEDSCSPVLEDSASVKASLHTKNPFSFGCASPSPPPQVFSCGLSNAQ
jgi:hypothetical protein